MRGVSVGNGGGEVGGEGGEGGGWRLQRSYWQKAVVNKWVLSLDLNSGRVEEFLRPDGREFQTEGARKLKEHSPKFWCCALGLSGASHTMSEGFVLVHMHIESEKDNLVESRQKSGRQKWLSCTVVGIWSVASAILAGVVSHDLIWTF